MYVCIHCTFLYVSGTDMAYSCTRILGCESYRFRQNNVHSGFVVLAVVGVNLDRLALQHRGMLPLVEPHDLAFSCVVLRMPACLAGLRYSVYYSTRRLAESLHCCWLIAIGARAA